MKMKIKCIDNKGHSYLTNGATYDAWFTGDDLWSSSDVNCGFSLFHGNLNTTAHGVFELVEESKPHPHADLMLKYAMISQYDDKPWENFEFKNQYSDGWTRVVSPCWDMENEYRLKPQEPKIKFGQVWIDFNGTQATVKLVSGGVVFFDVPVGGINMQHSLQQEYFLQNFKLKENK